MDSFNERLNHYKIPFALCLVGVVLISGGIFSSDLLKHPSEASEDTKKVPKESVLETKSIGAVKVDISGAVVNPGVFSLDNSARIEDAIGLAGGFVDSANKLFVTKELNLSQKVSDGLKLYIPFEGESLSSVLGESSTTKTISINKATEAELETLPGIGPSTAAKIIKNRPYSELTALVSKKALSQSVYQKISELISL